MRNTPIRRSTKRIRRESEKHRLKRLAEQSKPVSRPAIKRKSRPKPRNAKRKASEFARCYGSRERVAYIKSLPCLYCLMALPFLAFSDRVWKSDNAHTVTGGAGRKADADTIVPLCRTHHERYDQHLTPFDHKPTREYVKGKAPEIAALWERELVRRSGRASSRPLSSFPTVSTR